jgi:hypothetical protein
MGALGVTGTPGDVPSASAGGQGWVRRCGGPGRDIGEGSHRERLRRPRGSGQAWAGAPPPPPPRPPPPPGRGAAPPPPAPPPPPPAARPLRARVRRPPPLRSPRHRTRLPPLAACLGESASRRLFRFSHCHDLASPFSAAPPVPGPTFAGEVSGL